MEERRKKIKSLLDRGHIWTEIGKELGVAASTAYRWYYGSSSRSGQPQLIEVTTKKDLVRQYIALHGADNINIEELYVLAVRQFKDWKSEDKENVIRWIKQYIYQISDTSSEVKSAGEETEPKTPRAILSGNGRIRSFSVNEGEDYIRKKATHIHSDVVNIVKSLYQVAGTKTPVGSLKSLLKKSGWVTEWKITDKIVNRADAFKDRIVVELEFSNRDQCHRDFIRFAYAFKKNKIDAAVLITFQNINAVARWKLDKSMKEKGSIQYLTLDWLKDTVDEFKPVLSEVPVWFIGIQ